MIKQLLSDFINLIFPRENNAGYCWGEIITVLVVLIFLVIVMNVFL